jgi:hypothetical protein
MSEESIVGDCAAAVGFLDTLTRRRPVGVITFRRREGDLQLREIASDNCIFIDSLLSRAWMKKVKTGLNLTVFLIELSDITRFYCVQV